MPAGCDDNHSSVRLKTRHCGRREPIPDILPLGGRKGLFDLLDIVIDDQDVSTTSSNWTADTHCIHTPTTLREEGINLLSVTSQTRRKELHIFGASHDVSHATREANRQIRAVTR